MEMSVDWFTLLYGALSAIVAVAMIAGLLWAARQDGEANRLARPNAL
jgi:hypothetical protein